MVKLLSIKRTWVIGMKKFSMIIIDLKSRKVAVKLGGEQNRPFAFIYLDTAIIII